VRWLIKTKDPKAWDAMVAFRDEFKKAFTETMSGFRLKLVKDFIPKLEPFLEKREDGIVFGLPVAVPEFMNFRKSLEKLTGIKFEPRWQKKTIENLVGYLKAMEIEFESVEYIGD